MEVGKNIIGVQRQVNSVQPSFKAARYVYWRELANDIFKSSEGFTKGLQSLGINNGENLNNIVTAVGTAAVAPVFIRYNPIAKEDKETKAYSAWRQPISAVIALAFQLPIMTAYNNMVDRHASTLKTDRMDLSSKPRMAALKNRIKSDWSDEKIKAINENRAPVKKAEFFETRLKHYQDQAFYAEVKNLRTNMKNMDIKEFDLVKPEELKDAKDAVLKTVLKKKFNVKEYDVADTNEYLKFADFKKDGKALIKKYGIKYSDLVESVEEAAKEYSIKKALADIASEAKVKLDSSNYVTRMSNHLEIFKDDLKKLTSVELSLKHPGQKFDDLVEFKKTEIFNATIKTLKAEAEKYALGTAQRDGVELVLKKLEESKGIDKIKCHGKTMDEVVQSVKLKKFLKVKINRAEEVLKNYKKQSGLLVGLAILPLTCGLLNWAYPRIMEKYFPELTAAKTSKTGALAAGKNPNQQEKVADKKEVK